MNKLDRYIIRSILGMVIMVMFAMLGLRIFIAFFQEAQEFGQGNYGLWQGIQFMMLSMPLYLYQLFPNIALLGTLMSLGLLAQNSELVVMRSSGMSFLRIVWAVMQAALIMTILMTIIGEGLGPYAASWAEQRKADQKTGGKMLATEYGIWMREGNDFINIKSHDLNGGVSGVTRFVFNKKQQLESLSYAKSGRRKSGDEWQFFDVKTSHFSPQRVRVTHDAEQDGKLALLPKLTANLIPGKMPIPKLAKQMSYRQKAGLSANDLALSFWLRLFQPLTTLLMVFLAIPFIFGPLRSVTMGLRILAGVMVGLAYYIFNRFFGPFSVVYQLPPFIAAVIPPAIFGLLAIILTFRKK